MVQIPHILLCGDPHLLESGEKQKIDPPDKQSICVQEEQSWNFDTLDVILSYMFFFTENI